MTGTLDVAALALAGAAGATLRFVLSGRSPWRTVAINVSGSFVLGVLVGLARADLTLIVGTGFCGGFTTFSTASVETVRLAQQRRYRAAVLHGLGGLLLTVAAGGLGLFLASA